LLQPRSGYYQIKLALVLRRCLTGAPKTFVGHCPIFIGCGMTEGPKTASTRFLLSSAGATRFLRCAMVCAPNFAPCGSALGLDALPEGVHEIYDIGAGRLFRPFDFLTLYLFFDQLF
jgi:hypothetical protein